MRRPPEVNHKLANWKDNELEHQARLYKRQLKEHFFIGLTAGLLFGSLTVAVVGGLWV